MSYEAEKADFFRQFLPTPGYAVEAGALDGTSGSTTLSLEREGWQVLCVEANIHMEGLLRAVRKTVIIAALGSEDLDSIPFHIYESSPGSFSALTPDTTTYPGCNGNFETIHVPLRTLNSCLRGVGFPRLDLLCLDLEGGELPVLTSLDWGVWCPKVVCVENWVVEDTVKEDFLTSKGYSLRRRWEVDDVYVHDEV